MEHIDECAKVFLRDQKKLFDEEVVFDIDEAKDFLEDSCAVYCKDIKAVKKALDDMGMDVSEVSAKELEDELEVFKLDKGGYFIVEG